MAHSILTILVLVIATAACGASKQTLRSEAQTATLTEQYNLVFDQAGAEKEGWQSDGSLLRCAYNEEKPYEPGHIGDLVVAMYKEVERESPATVSVFAHPGSLWMCAKAGLNVN